MWKYLYWSTQLFLRPQVLFELTDEDQKKRKKKVFILFPLSSCESCFKYRLQICIPNVLIMCIVLEMWFNVPMLGQTSFWKQALIGEVPGWKVGFVKFVGAGIWWVCHANKWNTIKVLRECPNEVCMKCVDNHVWALEINPVLKKMVRHLLNVLFVSCEAVCWHSYQLL